MSVISMAVIGKNNEPLYLREFYDSDSIGEEGCCTDEELFGLPPSATVHLSPPTTVKVHSGIDNKISTECSLRQQFILHAALDRFEQIAGPHPGFGWRTSSVSGQEAMWVGLLCPVEDMRVYGKCVK